MQRPTPSSWGLGRDTELGSSRWHLPVTPRNFLQVTSEQHDFAGSLPGYRAGLGRGIGDARDRKAVLGGKRFNVGLVVVPVANVAVRRENRPRHRLPGYRGACQSGTRYFNAAGVTVAGVCTVFAVSTILCSAARSSATGALALIAATSSSALL